jgi:hypothetical protein
LEVADIFRDHGVAWRRANAGHVSLDQMKVMSAIERCRTVALVGLQPTGSKPDSSVSAHLTTPRMVKVDSIMGCFWTPTKPD